MTIVACSKPNHEPQRVHKKTSSSCLSKWFGSQYAYFNGKENFSSNLETHTCASQELKSLQNQVKDEIALENLKDFWRGGQTPVEVLNKAMIVKTWLVGGHKKQLKKSEISELIHLLKQWEIFLQRTKNIVPIMQRKRGEGDLVYFEESYRSAFKYLNRFLQHMPPLLEPFDLDILCSLLSSENKQSVFLKNKNYFLSLILLANKQERELDLRKTAEVIYRAIEIEQNFKYQFKSSWKSLFDDFEKFYAWLRKPKVFFEEQLDDNGSLPFSAFEKLAQYLSAEVYKEKYSSKMLHNSLRVFVQKILSSNESNIYTGITHEQWDELVSLYRKWGWLERNQSKKYYYEGFINLISTTIIENYSIPGFSVLFRAQFSELYEDGKEWAEETQVFDGETSAQLAFFDADLFSKTGNGDLRVGWLELKRALEKSFRKKKSLDSEDEQRKIITAMFEKFDKDSDQVIKNNESKELFRYFVPYITKELGFSEGWQSRLAYFYWIRYGEWPEEFGISYYYNLYTFSSEISLEDFYQMILSTRKRHAGSSLTH